MEKNLVGCESKGLSAYPFSVFTVSERYEK